LTRTKCACACIDKLLFYSVGKWHRNRSWSWCPWRFQWCLSQWRCCVWQCQSSHGNR